ncbi:MAG: hypothetical protein U5K75_02345 [Ahrensia sp.]|nr:hypothetical protein [Ahrensia sp.]
MADIFASMPVSFNGKIIPAGQPIEGCDRLTKLQLKKLGIVVSASAAEESEAGTGTETTTSAKAQSGNNNNSNDREFVLADCVPSIC